MEGCVAAGMVSVAKHVARMLLNQVWEELVHTTRNSNKLNLTSGG
jgi:hypothetical protein